MDHPLPPPPSALWRTVAVFAASVATLELLGLIALGMIALPLVSSADARPAVARKAAPAPKKRVRPAAPVPQLSRTRTAVLVLNRNGRTGAAAAAAETVKGLRYRIRAVGNAPSQDFTRSVVMYRPGRQAEATRLARDLRIATVSPLDGLRPADLRGAHVALIVGT